MQHHESIKVMLRKKRGRSWQYQEIEIPTDAEMERIASSLHSKHQPALIDCLGWKVFYSPAIPLNFTTTPISPFTGEQGQSILHPGTSISYCVFGYGAEWQVCYSWSSGEDQPPVRIQEKGDIVLSRSCPQGSSSHKEQRSSSIDDCETLFEGALRQAELSIFERNPKARTLCIQHYGAKCFVCGFDFGSVYGQLAKGFTHVHHLNPIAEAGAEYEVDPVQDLRPVCPNCHAVLHMRTPPFNIEEVKAKIRRSS